MIPKKKSTPASQARSRKLLKGDKQLSAHFTLFELTATIHDDFVGENRILSKDQVEKLELLCTSILEPIRKQFRLPITITSGYRCPGLNVKIGGTMKSQHSLCEAADFIINGLDDLEGSIHIFEWIYLKSNIKFGQLIHEHTQRGTVEKVWLHISLGYPHRSKSRCMQVFKYRKGEYQSIVNPNRIV